MDKKTKTPASFDKLVHVVMTPKHGPVVVDVDTRKLENFNPESYKSPFKKGDVVAVIVTGYGMNQGLITARGEVHVLTA